MSITTQPLSPYIGLEVIGIDLASDFTERDRSAILNAWVEGGILLFRNCESEEQLLRLSECFGRLEPSATKALNTLNSPYLMSLKHDPEQPDAPGTQMLVNGEQRNGWLGWHWDQSFMPIIVRGAALRMTEPAAIAGETGFIDGIAAYERLSDAMKSRIENLEVVYEFTGEMEKNRFGFPKDLRNLRSKAELEAQKKVYDFPPVVHPMVVTQPETGRKVLKLSPMHARYILGMERAESDALLTELADHLVDPRYAYFHRWTTNDVLVWDNWRVIHSAQGVPPHVRRVAQRTTIVGDYGYGRYLDGSRERTQITDKIVD